MQITYNLQIIYICTKVHHSLQSFVAPITVISLLLKITCTPFIETNLTLLELRYAHPFPTYVQTISIFFDQLYSPTLFLFQLLYALVTLAFHSLIHTMAFILTHVLLYTYFNTSVAQHFYPIKITTTWNALPSEVVSSRRVNSFKNSLEKHWAENPPNV